VQQVFCHLLLVLRDRLQVDQFACHFKWMHGCFSSSAGFSLWVLDFARTTLRRLKPAPLKIGSIVILRKEWRAGKKQDAGRHRAPCSSIALHPNPRDDSGPVLTQPPSRLGGTAVGDFGGKSCCTFRSGLRSSSEPRPGYSLLPHLYQDLHKISLPHASGQISDSGPARSPNPRCLICLPRFY
jgi:hypothetical protein